MSSWLPSGTQSSRTGGGPSSLSSAPRRTSSTTSNRQAQEQDAKMQIDGIAPTFQKKPSIRHEQAGKKLVFECFLEAEPEPSVKWFHNGQALSQNARFKVSYLT